MENDPADNDRNDSEPASHPEFIEFAQRIGSLFDDREVFVPAPRAPSE